MTLYPLDSARNLKKDIAAAGGIIRYQYAYAFDAFRRGWQYALSCSIAGHQVWYCPHRIRQLALESGSREWLESAREIYWSWGRCIVGLIDSNRALAEPERVADWINGILDAAPPRWMSFAQTVPEEGADVVSRQRIRELIELLEDVARHAKIPMALMKEPALPIKLANVVLTEIHETLRLGTIESVLHLLPTQRAVETVTFHAGEVIKDAANIIHRGTFGYPGLISKPLRDRSDPPRRSEYLL